MDEIIEHLKNFYYGEIYFKVQFKENVELPILWLKTLRGGFGRSLQYISCITKTYNCKKCKYKKGCIYFNFFEPITVNDQKYKKIHDIPRPFILQKIKEKKNVKTGDDIIFKINVFGPFIDKYSFIILAVNRLANFGLFYPRVKFRLVEAYTNINNQKVILFDGVNMYEHDIKKKLSIGKLRKNKLIIKTITPIEIIEKGKLVIDYKDLSPLLNSISRKFKLLYYFLYENNLEIKNTKFNKNNYKVLQNNLNVINIKRKSQSTRQKMFFNGVTGEIIISGQTLKDLNIIYPLLKLGTILNIGKHTTFGMGQIKIITGGINVY